MPNNIIKVAIHDLRKTDNDFEVILGPEGTTINGTTQRVVDDLHDLYSRRTSKSHGRFSDNQSNYPTQRHLRTYLEGSNPDFGEFTSNLMTTLRVQANLRSNALGGHVFFAHFERDARQFLLVAIVNDKLGARLTRDFEVRDVSHLDMEGFRFAGRIDISGWLENGPRYIGFLRGKGDVSEYFKEFLGCDLTTQDRQDTADLVVALKYYAEQKRMEGPRKDEFLSRAKNICYRASTNRVELDFESLANELVPDEPNSLLSVLIDPDRALNDRFIPDRRALGTLVRFKGKTKFWSLEFEREGLTGGRITYDEAEDSLTLRGLPEDLVAQLRRESSSDGQH